MSIVRQILDGANVRDTLDKDLLEMANLLGKRVTIENINFSFYFSSKIGLPHDIRVKIKWDRDRFIGVEDGYMELHGNYLYHHSVDTHVSEKEIEQARTFFKKYKVLFAAVWEDELDPDSLQEFFRGNINFSELKEKFDFGAEILSPANNLRDIEKIVRANKYMRCTIEYSIKGS